MVAQCLRAPTGVNGQQVLQDASGDAIGHQGGKVSLQLIQLRRRSASRWPTYARLGAMAGRAQKPGKPHHHFAEQRRDAVTPPVLQVALSGAAPATRPQSPMTVDLPGNHRSLNARQKLLRFGQGQTPGSRYRQDLPAGRSLPGRCSGSGYHRRSQATATPIAFAFPQPAIDPTDRTSRGVIPPFSGHSRPNWLSPVWPA